MIKSKQKTKPKADVFRVKNVLNNSVNTFHMSFVKF